MTISQDEVAKHVEQMLTPELQRLAGMIQGEMPEGWGFGLLMFEFTEKPGGPLLWVSNAERPQMIVAMQEYVDRIHERDG